MKKYLNRLVEKGASGIVLAIAVFLCPAGYSELFGMVMKGFHLSYDGTRLVFYLLSGLFFLFYILLLLKDKGKNHKA
jgi:hypothetical protein